MVLDMPATSGALVPAQSFIRGAPFLAPPVSPPTAPPEPYELGRARVPPPGIIEGPRGTFMPTWKKGN